MLHSGIAAASLGEAKLHEKLYIADIYGTTEQEDKRDLIVCRDNLFSILF